MFVYGVVQCAFYLFSQDTHSNYTFNMHDLLTLSIRLVAMKAVQRLALAEFDGSPLHPPYQTAEIISFLPQIYYNHPEMYLQNSSRWPVPVFVSIKRLETQTAKIILDPG